MDILIYLLIGALGVIGHCLMKASSLQKDASTANIDFSFTDYLRKDALGIALSFLAVVMWVFLFEETMKFYPKLENWIRLSFAEMGFLGSYIIQVLFSKSKKYIRSVVDEKTNELDELKK